MNNPEQKVQYKSNLFNDNGHKDNGHKNNGHDNNNGHDKNNGHKHANTQELKNSLEVSLYEIPLAYQKYTKVSLDNFYKFFGVWLYNPENVDESFKTIMSLLMDLELSIRIVKQLTDDGGSWFPELFEEHYPKAEYLYNFFMQFLWFSELKEKNPCFDFSTISNNGHNGSK
jgi:hypothetical protein